MIMLISLRLVKILKNLTAVCCLSALAATVWPFISCAAVALPHSNHLISGNGISLEFDQSLQSRVISTLDSPSLGLTDFTASDFAVDLKGVAADQFTFQSETSERISGTHGPGMHYALIGTSAINLQKLINITFYDRYPGLAVIMVSYKNNATKPFVFSKWVNSAYTLKSAPSGFWAYQGASFSDRRDWLRALPQNFQQQNYMGMNASDYGSGTPILDVWRKDIGLAIGHIETKPQLVSLPISVTAAGAKMNIELETSVKLASGDSFSTLETFIYVHHRDHYSTLKTFRHIMADNGLKQAAFPQSSYDPIWCAWGYERDFSVAKVRATLPVAKALGLAWAGVDDGWQNNVGDWKLDLKKFPHGDADMIALVKDIKHAGLKAKLWISPLGVSPGSDLLHDHTDMLLLDKDGAVQNITWWNSFYLCPAYPKTIENIKALVTHIMKDWGYDGLKIDGQHLNGVAPCYNKAHHHARPEESVEQLQNFYKVIYETAIAINPNAVIEICPCGTSQSFYNMIYQNQSVASDPETSWQVRLKGKTMKGLMGDDAPFAGDHVELSNKGADFASTVGIGAVVSTKFTTDVDEHPEKGFVLTPEKAAVWKKWTTLYNTLRLSNGTYRGELYDIGFDKPESHVIEKNNTMYYAFYADDWNGEITLRGLADKSYHLVDYVNNRDLGIVKGPNALFKTTFKGSLLLKAEPVGSIKQ